MAEVGTVLVMRVCAAIGVLALGACTAGAPMSNPDANKSKSGGFFAGFLASDTDSKSDAPAPTKRPKLPTPLAKAPLAGGDVVVAAPPGYCIDPTTVQSRPARGFAVIASCNILSGGKVAGPVDPAIVTVTAGPRGDVDNLPTPAQIAGAVNARLIGGESRPGYAAAHIGRGGQDAFPGSDPRHWRGAFVQGDRLVGLALYAPKGSTLASEPGGALLRQVADTIRTATPTTPQAVAVAKTSPRETGLGKGLFGRLFDR